MQAAIIVILYLVIILFDFLPTVRKKQKKITWIYFAFLAFSFSLLILSSIGIKIPSISGLILTGMKSIYPIG